MTQPAATALPLRAWPEGIALCARWNFEQWGRDLGRDLPGTEEALRYIAAGTAGQDAVIGFLDGKPAGMALLIDCDLESHAHLKPWVASVYTVPEARGRGVATAMMLKLEDLARDYGFEAAYLYTGIPDFYAPLGWKVIGVVQEDEPMSVMKRTL